MDLFKKSCDEQQDSLDPLAARMRPGNLDEVVGQEHLLGEGKLLRRAIAADRLNSIILYGPPGCGKTSLAGVIANVTRRRFSKTSGATANVSILRDLLTAAADIKRRDALTTILFIDEIHRFNKAQQDILLPYVEDGSVTLVGATTHNPGFFINSPLTSRSLIFDLVPLSEEAIKSILHRALIDKENGLGQMRVTVEESALEHLAMVCEGDARRALNALEIAVLTSKPGSDGTVHISLDVAESSIQKKAVTYDHDEDGHYDTISAFIKSIRGSDPDAAVYWLAKMLYAGEDPRFIARRMIILASEDIGNADPRALSVAVSTFMGVDFVGMPEARIILAQAVTYLATTPKSNASYMAVKKALNDVEHGRTHEVPEHLRNVHLNKVREAGSLDDEKYKYPHDYEGGVVDQLYFPSKARYYVPGTHGYEDTIRRRMDAWGKKRKDKKQEI